MKSVGASNLKDGGERPATSNSAEHGKFLESLGTAMRSLTVSGHGAAVESSSVEATEIHLRMYVGLQTNHDATVREMATKKVIAFLAPGKLE